MAQFPAQLARLTVYNKIDLVSLAAERREEADAVAIALSARTGAGIELLRQELLRIAGWHPAEDVFIARERHLRALARQFQFEAMSQYLVRAPSAPAHEPEGC